MCTHTHHTGHLTTNPPLYTMHSIHTHKCIPHQYTDMHHTYPHTYSNTHTTHTSQYSNMYITHKHTSHKHSHYTPTHIPHTHMHAIPTHIYQYTHHTTSGTHGHRPLDPLPPTSELDAVTLEHLLVHLLAVGFCILECKLHDTRDLPVLFTAGSRVLRTVPGVHPVPRAVGCGLQ
jgi:hypothetical protein